MDPQMITLFVGASLLTFSAAVFAWAFATRRRSSDEFPR